MVPQFAEVANLANEVLAAIPVADDEFPRWMNRVSDATQHLPVPDQHRWHLWLGSLLADDHGRTAA